MAIQRSNTQLNSRPRTSPAQNPVDDNIQTPQAGPSTARAPRRSKSQLFGWNNGLARRPDNELRDWQNQVEKEETQEGSQKGKKGFRGLARRASTSISRALQPFHHASHSMGEPMEDVQMHPTVLTPPIEGHDTPVPENVHKPPPKKPLAFWRRHATSGPSGATGRWNPQPLPLIPVPDVATLYTAPQYPSAPGDAARRAAAAENERRGLKKQQSPNRSEGYAESAVGVEPSDCTGTATSSIIRKDFAFELPRELVELIFSFCDDTTLSRTLQVSKVWNEIASGNFVWRSVFLGKYQPKISVSPAPLLMGGAGVGGTRPGQDWKKMSQLRRTLERRWKTANPGAIYLSGHTDSVYCCQFDEDKIITGSRDRTIRVWDLHTYECLKVIGGPGSKPQPNTPSPHLDPHPTGTVHDIRSINGTAKGDSIYHTPNYWHSASILCLQFDDEVMVTGSSDNTCIVWDLKTWQPKFKLVAHEAGVLDVCLDSKYIISCSKDTVICVWDRETGELIQKLGGHNGPVNAVQLRGHFLVSASGDGHSKLWDLRTWRGIKDFSSQGHGLAAVEFSDDAKFILAGGNDKVIYKFDINSDCNSKVQYTGHDALVRSLFLDTQNNRVISGSYDQSIRIYNYTTCEPIADYPNWTTSWILSAKADYRRVVATSQDGRVLILDFGYGMHDIELLNGSAAYEKETAALNAKADWMRGRGTDEAISMTD